MGDFINLLITDDDIQTAQTNPSHVVPEVQSTSGGGYQ